MITAAAILLLPAAAQADVIVDGNDAAPPDGTYRNTVTIPKHAPAGTYTVTCTAYDAVGRYGSCPDAPTITVTGGDAAPPAVTSVTATPTAVDVTTASAQVTIEARVTDDLSGVSAVVFSLYNNTASVGYGGGFATRQAGTDLDGTYRNTVTIPKHAPAGTYTVTCTAYDAVGRYGSCSSSPRIEVQDTSVDLSTQLTSASLEVAPGGDLSLTAEIGNAGPSEPVDSRVTIPVPTGTTLVSAPAGCTRLDDGPVTCAIESADLAAGRSVTREVVLKVATDATGSITASATATSSSEERTPANNTATLSIPIVAPEAPEEPDPSDPPNPGAPAKLSLSSSVSPAEALPGDTVTYTLTATNGSGAGNATGTVVSDVLPDGVTFLDASEGCTNATGTVRCELGTIAAGASSTATIRATVDPIPMKADPNSAHQVLEQKAETDLRVERGETRTATASCPTGYFATDGGIRLDAVDQGGSVTATSVPASGPTADGSGWTATLHNDNPGAALAKVTVACLARTTVTGEHQHDLVTSTVSAPAQPLAAGSTTVEVACPAGQTPFAPSYALSGTGTVSTSKETGNSWTFVVDSPAEGSGDFAIGCLGTRTTTAAGHYHVLGIDHRAETVTVPAGQTVETQLTCADEAKGIVASRRIDTGLVDRGTDPRAKIRSFRLTNPTDHALTADLGLTCVDIRTSGEPVALRIANTATVSTTADDATTGDDAATATFTAYGDGWAILPTTTANVAGGARSASVGVAVRCASDCVVSARLVALGRVPGTALRSGATIGTGRAVLVAGDSGRVTLRATGAAAKALTARHLTRAKVVITTSEGATTTRTVTLRR
ncbi:MAG: DUF11 domain-containing protein [Nocardioides sp.]|nr:DUF11 domain-containing protein [Nocardioides sp.]